MTTEERVMTLLIEANPIPDIDSLDLVDVGGTTYLATLNQRSSEMIQIEETPPEVAPKRRRPIVAAALTAVIGLIVGLVLVISNQTAEETPPATDPTPTTAVTPTTIADVVDPAEAAALAIATGFFEARAGGDADAATSFAFEGHINLGLAESLAAMPDEMAWLDATGWRTEVDTCTVTSPDPANLRVTCTVTHDNAWSRALGLGPYPGEYYIRIEEGEVFGQVLEQPKITQVVSRFIGTAFLPEAWNPFVSWVETNHPDDVDTMFLPSNFFEEGLFLPGERHPSLTPESIELWRQYTEEFVAEKTGN